MPALYADDVVLDVDAVLFDKDGTLVPFAPSWTSWGQALVTSLVDGAWTFAGVRPELTPPLHTDPDRNFGRDTLHLANATGLRTRYVEELAAHGIAAADADRLLAEAITVADRAMARHELVAYPDALASVRRCADAGLPVGVVTGDDAARARTQLSQLGIIERCATVVGGDAGVPGKPDPAPLRLACEQMAIAAERVAYVGDSLVDLTAARAAGAHAIAFAPAQEGPAAPWTGDADAVIVAHRQLQVT